MLLHDDTGATKPAAHDATGVVWGPILGLLLWPLIFVLGVAAAAVLL